MKRLLLAILTFAICAPVHASEDPHTAQRCQILERLQWQWVPPHTRCLNGVCQQIQGHWHHRFSPCAICGDKTMRPSRSPQVQTIPQGGQAVYPAAPPPLPRQATEPATTPPKMQPAGELVPVPTPRQEQETIGDNEANGKDRELAGLRELAEEVGDQTKAIYALAEHIAAIRNQERCAAEACAASGFGDRVAGLEKQLEALTGQLQTIATVPDNLAYRDSDLSKRLEALTGQLKKLQQAPTEGAPSTLQMEGIARRLADVAASIEQLKASPPPSTTEGPAAAIPSIEDVLRKHLLPLAAAAGGVSAAPWLIWAGMSGLRLLRRRRAAGGSQQQPATTGPDRYRNYAEQLAQLYRSNGARDQLYDEHLGREFDQATADLAAEAQDDGLRQFVRSLRDRVRANVDRIFTKGAERSTPVSIQGA